MSDNIPFEIQIEIIKRFPIKSLIRFRSVSKSWKSSINSSKFINDYNLLHAQCPEHVLIRYNDQVSNITKYVSIIDDDNDDSCFTQHNVLSAPMSITLLPNSLVVGSSHGLLCFFGYYQEEGESVFSSRAVIWNPSIRKSVTIDTPDVLSNSHEYGPVVGFGVCPDTIDPKIVRINDLRLKTGMENITCNYWEVEVLTLSSGVWRSKLKLNHVPSQSINFISSDYTVVVDRFIYWIASSDGFSIILSFDLTSEEFKKIYLPVKVAAREFMDLPIFKLRESLVVVECKKQVEKQVYTAWMMMEKGFLKSFTKLFIVKLPCDHLRGVVGFRKNDQLIMEQKDDEINDGDDNDNDDEDYDDDNYDYDFYINNVKNVDESVLLVGYEPCSKRVKSLGIYGESESFIMSSYKESLLLLDQPNSIIGRYRHDGHIAET